jgi:hypothetical protein
MVSSTLDEAKEDTPKLFPFRSTVSQITLNREQSDAHLENTVAHGSLGAIAACLV